MKKNLNMVQQDGFALRYVEEQTPEICLAAVQQNGYALRFVKEQTPEICLAAVQQDGYALQYVKEQTPEIRRAARKQINCIFSWDLFMSYLELLESIKNRN